MKNLKLFPVLIIGFNRAEFIESLLSNENLKNRDVFIAIDGPRLDRDDDLIVHEKIKKIIDEKSKFDNVYTLINDKNLGCKRAEQTAMTWFFANVEAGIVLEDDVRPTDDFFEFCDKKLEEFEGDSTIWAICGHVPNQEFISLEDDSLDYFFSDTPMTYGWASWSRVWKRYQYDFDLIQIFKIEVPLFQSSKFRQLLFRNIWQRRVFDELFHNVNTWDYQFTVSCWSNKGRNIFPKRHSTKNVGYDEGATHTKSPPSEIKNYKASHHKLKYDDILKNYEIDTYYQKNKFRKIVSNWVLLIILRFLLIFIRNN